MGEMQFAGGVYQTLPARAYCDEALFAEEKARIFRRSWQLIGHATDIPHAGDYVVEEVGGTSVIVMRGQDAVIRAFYNVCIHRGHELLQGKGCAKKMTCPYHAWTYDTTGALRALPNEAGFPGFDKQNYRLRAVRVEVFFGLILVNLDDAAKSFAELAAEAVPEIADYAPNLDRYMRAARTERLAAANWKVVAENFNECYHCAIVHKTLTTGVIDPDQYRTRGHDYGIRHVSPARPDARQSYHYVADPAAKTDKFLTWWFFPLVALADLSRWHREHLSLETAVSEPHPDRGGLVAARGRTERGRGRDHPATPHHHLCRGRADCGFGAAWVGIGWV